MHFTLFYLRVDGQLKTLADLEGKRSPIGDGVAILEVAKKDGTNGAVRLISVEYRHGKSFGL